MILQNNKVAVAFHAHVSKDWDQAAPSTYDPEYLWEETFTSVETALERLRDALHRVAQDVPWPHGYLPCVIHLGPRGGIYKVTLERTVEHPTLDAAMDVLASRQ